MSRRFLDTLSFRRKVEKDLEDLLTPSSPNPGGVGKTPGLAKRCPEGFSTSMLGDAGIFNDSNVLIVVILSLNYKMVNNVKCNRMQEIYVLFLFYSEFMCHI